MNYNCYEKKVLDDPLRFEQRSGRHRVLNGLLFGWFAAVQGLADVTDQFRFIFADAQTPDFVRRVDAQAFGQLLDFLDTHRADLDTVQRLHLQKKSRQPTMSRLYKSGGF